MASIEEIISGVNKAITDREAEIKGLSEEIAGAAELVEKNKAEMKKAQDSHDPEKYATAKRALEISEATIEMDRARLDELQKGPVLTREQYKKIHDAARPELDRMTEKTEAQLVKDAEKLRADAESLEDAVKQYNDIMNYIERSLQKTVEKGRGNRPTYTYSGAYSAIAWSKSAIGQYEYKRYKNEHKDK